MCLATIAVCVLLSFAHGASLPLSTATPYTQTFDSLVATGSASFVPAGMQGWSWGTSRGPPAGVYDADSGTNNTNGIYSYGGPGVGVPSDRAFGALASTAAAHILGLTVQNTHASSFLSRCVFV